MAMNKMMSFHYRNLVDWFSEECKATNTVMNGES
jgi:hypothetical protein